MTMVAVSAGVGIASAGYGAYKSIRQGQQADDLDAANKRPDYTIPDEYKQNLAMANHMARVGMPQQQYDNQLNAISRNQAGGLQQLGMSANPGAGLASIVRAGNDANNNLNAQDAAQRQNNQRYAIQQNGIMGQQQLAKQQYDKFDKYTENFNKAQALRGASNAGMNNAVNSLSGLAGGMAMSGGLGFGGNGNEDGGITNVLPGATMSPGYNNSALNTQRYPIGFNQINQNGMPVGPQWNQF